ncbi:MAG: hypothetical protein JWM68_3924 [Verrucomicrobiales bacterium]|nr:hypothetical protein [Verrucomicrobiales bacterium]
MKRFLRWLLYIFVALVVLGVIAFLSIDTIAKKMAEKRILKETGMIARIGQLHIGLSDHSLTIKNFQLLNPAEFGGGVMLDLPELHVEYDLNAARSNIVHLRLVKIDLARLHVVEHKDGTSNIDVFTKSKPKHRQTSAPTSPPSTNAPVRMPAFPYQFGGIDKLEVTLAQTKFSSDKYPERSFDRNLGIKNEVFKDIKTEENLQTVGIVLLLKSGLANLIQGSFF